MVAPSRKSSPCVSIGASGWPRHPGVGPPAKPECWGASLTPSWPAVSGAMRTPFASSAAPCTFPRGGLGRELPGLARKSDFSAPCPTRNWQSGSTAAPEPSPRAAASSASPIPSSAAGRPRKTPCSAPNLTRSSPDVSSAAMGQLSPGATPWACPTTIPASKRGGRRTITSWAPARTARLPCC